MKKRLFFGISSVIVLLSLAVSMSLAQEVQPESADNASAAALSANAPWSTSWADNSTSASVGAYSSIAFSPVDYMPYISYYDAANGNLMLASPVTSGGNCGTNNRWWCRVVDGDGVGDHSDADVGKYSSIAFWKNTSGMLSWKLGITYYDVTNRALKYAVYRKFSINPASWDIVTIKSSAGLLGSGDGTYTSLKYNSAGEPQIAYHAWRFTMGGTVGYLKYAYSLTSGGNCGVDADAGKWQCDTVDSGDSLFGQYASLDVDYNDGPYIAYYDGDNGNLKYAYYAGIGTCGSGWECSTIDSTGDVGQFASLKAKQSSSDKLHIAYYDKTNGKLKYATSGWTGGNCGSGDSWYCMNVDTIGSGLTQVGISLDLDADGYPIIAYQDASEDLAPSLLNIARPASAYGEPLGIGSCGDPPFPGGLFSYFQCNTIDNAAYGIGYVYLADFTSVAVGPSGLAVIAYYEVDDYNLTQSLKVAYQQAQLFLPLLFK
jgi:hypothetical protein